MCGATEGGLALDGVDLANEAVVQGQVLRTTEAGEQEPVGNAYVRLLDRTGEFTAEVPTSATTSPVAGLVTASLLAAPVVQRPAT